MNVRHAVLGNCAKDTLTLTAAGMLAAAACASASSAAEPANEQTRAVIIGPLLEEMNAAPGPGLSLAPRADFAAATDFTAFSDAPSDDAAALSFARSGLLTRMSPDQRDSLAAFDGRRAVVATTASGGQFSVSLHDGAAPDRLLAFQSPDYSEAMLGRERDRPRNMAVRYQGRMNSAASGSGLDVGVTPRAGLGMGSQGPALEAGATLKVGRYLRDDYGSKPAWWFFAGADRQALLYNPRQGANLNSAVAFSPYAMVGDAQAGVAMRMGPADLSVAYVRRETEFSLPAQSWETVEDFAAFTLTMRR
ncbi:lipid A deacylase LpxR family protein [Glycocaulis profundi]|nr:lipid A deacylase LpxR family protein [Glycocaulis profundi]